jgi:hypothetical protein
MAITRDDIIWLEPGFNTPQRTADEDAKRWDIWADMTGTPWERRNHFPFALVATMQGTEAHFLVERLYELNGDKVRYGLYHAWTA